MQKEDWQKIAKWIGIAYLPIGIFVIFVFILFQWQYKKVERTQQEIRAQSATSTLIQ